MPDLNLEEKFNFGIVSDKKFYRSSQPNEEFLNYLKKIRKIKTIIILRMDIPEFEERFCRENSINLVRLPIKSWRRWPEPDEVRDFFKLFKYYWNLPVLIHCLKGKDRTSALVALFRIGCEGWRLKDAVAEMKQCKASWFWRLFIQTSAYKVIDGFKEKNLLLLYLKRFLNLIFAFEGSVFAFRHEKNLKIFLFFEAILLAIAVWLGISLVALGILLLSFSILDALEMFNTATERLIDIVQPRFDRRVKVIKDLLAGSVAFFGIITFIIWLILVFF